MFCTLNMANELEYEGEKYLIMSESDIYAIFE